MPNAVTDEAVEQGSLDLSHLAKTLYDRMEHLDPSNPSRDWEELSERERDFYRLCVETVLLEAGAL